MDYTAALANSGHYMKSRFTALLLVVTAMLCSQGRAADYYVCNTTENTGSDANDGLSNGNAWLTMDKGLSQLSAFSGGDTLSFCEGFDGTSTADIKITSSGSCQDSARCSVTSYVAAGQDGSDDGVLPKLRNSTYPIFQFDGDIAVDGGYNISNLEMIGGAKCVDIVDGFSHILFMTIGVVDCAIGVDIEVVEGQVSVDIDVVSPTFTNISDIGYRGSSSYGSLTDATFTDTGGTADVDHAILLQGADTRSFTLRNIMAEDTAHVGGACSSPVIKGVGSFRGLYFDSVHTKEAKGTASSECIGILLAGDYGDIEAHFNYVMFSQVTSEYNATSGIACQNCTNVTGSYNIIIGDDEITTGIDIPYGTESGVASNYILFEKSYIVLTGADTGRTAISINTPHSDLINNHIFKNDADDVCWNVNGSANLDNNKCMEATTSGLADSTNWLIN